MTELPGLFILERTACAKIILCGEHAVVYSRPAIALPLPALRAHARIHARVDGVRIVAQDIGLVFDLSPKSHHPLARIVTQTMEFVERDGGREADREAPAPASFELILQSDIPVSSHLGSGAAVSVACARAVAAHLGRELAPNEASDLAYEIEKIYHGTPSGIDNTVIAHEQPVWFTRGQPPVVLADGALNALHLVIADTGIATPTRIPVGQVRRGWEEHPAQYNALFDEIGDVVARARDALTAHDAPALGRLMNRNHALLQALGVSCPELDDLCEAARAAGALGAKLSGGGQGGNMIALARDADHARALRAEFARLNVRAF
ncbi:MAG TPA: mevalonate kinase [Thermoflexales bacterium]|nr:mevalonate kinase [Thermoflexales bacterium]